MPPAPTHHHDTAGQRNNLSLRSIRAFQGRAHSRFGKNCSCRRPLPFLSAPSPTAPSPVRGTSKSKIRETPRRAAPHSTGQHRRDRFPETSAAAGARFQVRSSSDSRAFEIFVVAEDCLTTSALVRVIILNEFRIERRRRFQQFKK